MTTPTDALKLARDALVYMLTEKSDYMLRKKLGDPSEEYATKIAMKALAAIDDLPASVLTGGSPEHMLQDQNRDLSQWLANQPGARLHATEAAAAIAAASVPNATPPAWARPLQSAANDVAPLPMMFPPPGGEEASAPSGEPVVRCELVESCRKCRHAVGRQSCALARRDIEGAGIPDWCPLPAYRATAQAAKAPAPIDLPLADTYGPSTDVEHGTRYYSEQSVRALLNRTQAPAAPAVAAPERLPANVKACVLSAIERGMQVLEEVATGRTLPRHAIRPVIDRLAFAKKALKGEASLQTSARAAQEPQQ